MLQNILSPPSRCLPSPASPTRGSLSPARARAGWHRGDTQGCPDTSTAPRTRGAPWQHPEHPAKHREGSGSTGVLLVGPCSGRECPPVWNPRLGAIPSLQLSPSEHSAVPWLVFHHWDVGLKHAHLGLGESLHVLRVERRCWIHTNIQQRARGCPHPGHTVAKGSGACRTPHGYHGTLSRGTVHPTVIGTPRSSRGSVLSCR